MKISNGVNKKISFPIAIIIIVVCAVLVGVIAWQYRIIPEIGPSGPSPRPSEKEVDCSEITSMLNIEKCIGKKIEAIGILECEKPGVPSKAGIHYLRFEDGTELKFLEGYQNCQSYNGKKVKVIGELYRCGERDQCAGVGLINIESVNFVEEVISSTTDKTEYKQGEIVEITITTDKAEYEQGETVEITVRNGLDKSIWYIKEDCPPSCCYLFRWENNEWRNLDNPMPCRQVIQPPTGGPYFIQPDELKPEGSISKQWKNSRVEWGTYVFGSGKYRFGFYYGLSKDNFTEKEIYSNEFTIK